MLYKQFMLLFCLNHTNKQMKTRIILIIFLIVFRCVSFSQQLETLGAGIIKFLLTNPSTANKTNPTESAALNVIGDLLSISAERKHEMNVAEAGKSEITINSNEGNQAKIYSDPQGNIYLLYNGLIYPISKTLVDEAKESESSSKISGSTLHPYGLSSLKSEFKFEKVNMEKEYFLQKNEESLCEIADKFNVPVQNIYLRNFLDEIITSDMKILQFKNLFSCKYYLKKEESGPYKGYAKIPHVAVFGGKAAHHKIFIRIVDIYENKIVTTFTCNWAKDFDGNGLDFKDFQNIKRSFYEREPILFVMGYTTESIGSWQLNVYESATGQLVYNNSGDAKSGAQIITSEVDKLKLIPGIYIYNFTFSIKDEKYSKSEKFEILPTKKDN